MRNQAVYLQQIAFSSVSGSATLRNVRQMWKKWFITQIIGSIY